MKILALVDRRFPTDHSFLEGLMEKRLTQMGHTILWVMQGVEPDNKVHKEKWIFSECIVLPNKSGPSLLGTVKNYFVLLRSLIGESARFSEFNPDLVYVRNDPLYLAFSVFLIAKKRCPIVFQLSHLKEEEILQKSLQKKGMPKISLFVKGWIARFLRNFSMSKCDHILPISDAMLEVLEQQNILSSRMTAVPLGIDSGAETMPVKFVDSGQYMVYVGTMDPRRGLATVIKAFAKAIKSHKDCKLLMIGGGYTPVGRSCLVELVSSLGVKSNVEFLDQMPRRDVYGLVKGAVLGLSAIPVDKINRTLSPTKLMEYLQCGCPVIATRGLPEQENIITYSGGGLLVDFNEESIAAAMCKLLDDIDMAREMGRLGRQYIFRERNYDRMVIDVDKILLNVSNAYMRKH